MKLPKFSFGNEWNELNKFESLDQQYHKIVFYAESSSSMLHFRHIIEELTQTFNLQLCYVTSNPNDPLLDTKNDKIFTFYIGDGTARTKFFLTLKASVLIMDMPDLETFHIKRSKVYPVHYVYLFHSMFSVHSYLRKGAVDHYDTIFCVGPHHIKEIRETEKVYGLKPKRLIEYGYGHLDTIMKERQRKQIIKNKEKTSVLIAPTYGPNNLIEKFGLKIIKILLDAGYHVTVRPHPITTKKSPDVIKRIKEEFRNNSDFVLETDILSFESLLSSHCMISDWSGISMEYAFGLEQPVIFIDVPKKIMNPNFVDISYEPIEINLRKEIGVIISPNDLEIIPKTIDVLCKNLDSFKEQIRNIREKTVFNIGKSGKIGAEQIVQLLDDTKGIVN